ncbi:hypothetical protein HanXRQr2_Chr02g0072861 [Helianthus annuus]|uniref:Uncharacterized protein n=1 Tax=Helianthus annuus TaxID=4232 RepID=A0A9K3JQB0_HELAN|nr:hypothetical protein HanXRQr2_Chr02g0072861 [Helianthus annuus]
MEERQRSPPTIPKIPAGAAKIPAETTSSTVEDLVELPSPESLSRMKEDIRTGMIIGRGTERLGLYYVDEVTQPGNVMLAHGTTNREAWLWHRRFWPSIYWLFTSFISKTFF